MEKVRIGVLGGYRGTSMINYCKLSNSACVVAICDKNDEVIATQKENLKDVEGVTYYSDFEEFLKHDMDAVVLANYANEHAPFAIRCLEKGLNVFSEVLPCQTMKEAVELIEAVERTGKVYAYGENYCYMPAPREMKRRYRQGDIGEFEYGEGEYIHNCEHIWPSITYGERDHWRNTMYSTFYCTHSLGPIIHITGLRPVSVTGFESTQNKRRENVGSLGAEVGIEMVTLENGAIVKSIHGGLYIGSIWYSIYGSKGSMESARESTENEGVGRVFAVIDPYEGCYDQAKRTHEDYIVQDNEEKSKYFGHGGSDFYCIDEFVRAVKGEKGADIIDVYEALDMFLPGLLAYRSVLDGGKPVEIPNLRDRNERDKWREDTACTDKNVAGDMLLPTRRGGTPDIPDSVYEKVLEMWNRDKYDGEYVNAVKDQGRVTEEK